MADPKDKDQAQEEEARQEEQPATDTPQDSSAEEETPTDAAAAPDAGDGDVADSPEADADATPDDEETPPAETEASEPAEEEPVEQTQPVAAEVPRAEDDDDDDDEDDEDEDDDDEEDDEFEEIPPSADVRQLEQNEKVKRSVLIGGVVLAGILLVTGGYWFWSYIQEQKNEEALKESIYAFNYYRQDSLQAAIEGKSPNPGLKDLASDYSSTKVGNQSQFLLGAAHYAQGNVEEGLNQFRKFDKVESIVTVSAYAAIAYGYEEKEDFKEAANYYLKAARFMENSHTSPMMLQHAARCYEAAGDNDNALDLYEDIKKKYPNSQPGKQVDKYIAKLSS